MAGRAATAGTGGTGAFGPAAAAVNAKVKRSVAMMSRVNNPIFFKSSSLSEFRLGRDRSDSLPAGTLLKLTQGDRDTAQYSRRFGARPVLQKVTRLMLHAMIVVGATTGRPEPIEVEYRPRRQVA